MRVAVVGSGLAAVGAIRALLELGHRPLVLDIGQRLPAWLSIDRERMGRLSPNEWSRDDWLQLGRNDGVPGRVVPRKLVFGSDYFYSTEQARPAPLDMFAEGSPPWSPARGGFSVGWGGAVLPPGPTDLRDWPVTHKEILDSMRAVLSDIPISEPNDEIGRVFGRLCPAGSDVLKLSSGQKDLLERLSRMTRSDGSTRVLVGQSRLLTQGRATEENRCRYCGHCSAGCVYGAIYTAELDIDRWIREDQISYRDNATVIAIEESEAGVRIRFMMGRETGTVQADRLYLAAGAVNSTRILMNSAPFEIDQAIIRRTGGTLQLFASARSIDLSWPEVNTQTSHFAELYSDRLTPFWSHVQIGQPNELILRRLGFSQQGLARGVGRLGRVAAHHLVSAALNTHSSLGPTYEMRIKRRHEGLPDLDTRQVWPTESRTVVRSISRLLSRSLLRAGFVQIPFTRQDSVAAHGYHFGASFPMRQKPTDKCDTDDLGRPFGWERVHVVDTSVLPAIPATTIGALTMANAYRIALRSANN